MTFRAAAALILLLNCSFYAQDYISGQIEPIYYITDFSALRDTVYTLKPYFIEVNLEQQMGYLHSRNDTVIPFGVSTGNPKLFEAIATKEGLYVIQSMMPKWYSRQFDSTLMLNWMGFNWGVGFHALLGNKYYKYLGNKRSSHGCIRISREMAKELYEKIDLGTPVLVHSGKNLIKVAFADPTENLRLFSYEEIDRILLRRYSDLISGNYYLYEREKILIDRNNVFHKGFQIGDSSLLPKRQIIFPIYKWIGAVTPAVKELVLIEKSNYIAQSVLIIN